MFVLDKEVACLIKGFKQKGKEPREGGTATLNHKIAFGDPNHAPWLADPLELAQQTRPIPLAQIALSKALIDQIKGLSWKIEPAQCIHHHKLDPITDSRSLGLSTSICHH